MLLYSVVIQPDERVDVDMRTSSIMPVRYVFQGTCRAMSVPVNPVKGETGAVPTVTAVDTAAVPSI
jgi:hypothetical protein